MKASGNERAFTVLELMLVVLIVAVLLALWLPTLKRVDKRSPQIHCVNNLKQVGLAFRIWADDNGDIYPMRYRTNDFDGPSLGNGKQMFIYFQVLSNELNTPKLLHCPSDKKRMAAADFASDLNSGRVSFFIGLDSKGDFPRSFLAGDRNLTNGTVSQSGMFEFSTNSPSGWTDELHRQQGNIALGDGSVQKVSAMRVRQVVGDTGLATNRLVFP